MYRNIVEIIDSTGCHSIYYGNGRVRFENFAHEFANDKTIKQVERTLIDRNMRYMVDFATVRLSELDEWVRIRQCKDGAISVRVVRITETV